jgi:hypothetical protein
MFERCSRCPAASACCPRPWRPLVDEALRKKVKQPKKNPLRHVPPATVPPLLRTQRAPQSLRSLSAWSVVHHRWGLDKCPAHIAHPGASAIIIIILVVQDLARTRLGWASVTRGRESRGELHSVWLRRLPFDSVFDSASASDRMTQVLGH